MKCTNLNILFCDWAPKLIIHKVIFIKSMNETLCLFAAQTSFLPWCFELLHLISLTPVVLQSTGSHSGSRWSVSSSACFCSPFTQSENDPLMRSCRKNKQLSLCGCFSADGGDGYAGCLAVKASRRFVNWFLITRTHQRSDATCETCFRPVASHEIRVWCAHLWCLQTEQQSEESHCVCQRMNDECLSRSVQTDY